MTHSPDFLFFSFLFFLNWNFEISMQCNRFHGNIFLHVIILCFFHALLTYVLPHYYLSPVFHCCKFPVNLCSRMSEMVQRSKILADKPEILSCIPEAHTVKEKNQIPLVFSVFHVSVPWHSHMHKHLSI